MVSVAARMTNARMEIMQSVNQAMEKNKLPAYIIESVLADIIGDVRQLSRIELLQEMEKEHGSMEQGIQQNKLAEQAVNSNADQCDKP